MYCLLLLTVDCLSHQAVASTVVCLLIWLAQAASTPHTTLHFCNAYKEYGCQGMDVDSMSQLSGAMTCSLCKTW